MNLRIGSRFSALYICATLTLAGFAMLASGMPRVEWIAWPALALTLLGASGSVHVFTLTLLIGIFSGTYSSIFNASMLLVMWEKGEWGFNLLTRRRDSVAQAGRRDREAIRELARP